MAKEFSLKQYLKNAIRRASYRHPVRSAAVNAVKVPAPASWPNKRVKYVAPCATCKQLFELSDIQVDHKEPIIPVSGWPEAPKSALYDANGGPCMNVLVYRTFVSVNSLQVLCKPCHKLKSQAENKTRRAA